MLTTILCIALVLMVILYWTKKPVSIDGRRLEAALAEAAVCRARERQVMETLHAELDKRRIYTRYAEYLEQKVALGLRVYPNESDKLEQLFKATEPTKGD